MGIFFTSDTHFGHEKVINFCDRPFWIAQDMDENLIKNWNSVVGKNDDVYHLGDFSFTKRPRTEEIIEALNGRIHLVRGNHDHKDTRKISKFAWVKDYHELKVVDGDIKQMIVLCHYPIESWNRRHHGSWHLHGHCHGSMARDKGHRRLDVGVDVHSYTPISYEQIRALMEGYGVKNVDYHEVKVS